MSNNQEINDLLNLIRLNGYCILPNVIPQDEVAKVREQ